jgi:hypothetical protein
MRPFGNGNGNGRIVRCGNGRAVKSGGYKNLSVIWLYVLEPVKGSSGVLPFGFGCAT